MLLHNTAANNGHSTNDCFPVKLNRLELINLSGKFLKNHLSSFDRSSVLSFFHWCIKIMKIQINSVNSYRVATLKILDRDRAVFFGGRAGKAF